MAARHGSFAPGWAGSSIGNPASGCSLRRPRTDTAFLQSICACNALIDLGSGWGLKSVITYVVTQKAQRAQKGFEHKSHDYLFPQRAENGA